MRKLTWTLVVALGMFCLTPNVMGATIFLADHMGNTGFDEAMGGWSSPHPLNINYRALGLGETVNSWTQAQNGATYWIQDTETTPSNSLAQSGDQYVMIHTDSSYAVGAPSGIASTPNVGLSSSNLYTFNVQLRKWNEAHEPTASLTVWVDAGAGLTEVAAVDRSLIGTETWSEHTISFAWAGDTKAAGEWNLVLGVKRPEGCTQYDGISIDSITVPEPTTMSLLLGGMVVGLFRRRK